MSQAKLSAVRELIKEKQYDAARALLETMPDDPTAREWLTKLNARLAQMEVKQAPAPTTIQVNPPPPKPPKAQINYTILQEQMDSARQASAAPDEPVENIGMAGCLRTGWGLLTLLALGWIAYGFLATASAAGTQLNSAEAQSSAGYQAGTLLGGGLSITFFLCTGLPLLLLFGMLYWRNGVAIRETKKHQQMVAAMRNRR